MFKLTDKETPKTRIIDKNGRYVPWLLFKHGLALGTLHFNQTFPKCLDSIFLRIAYCFKPGFLTRAPINKKQSKLDRSSWDLLDIERKLIADRSISHLKSLISLGINP